MVTEDGRKLDSSNNGSPQGASESSGGRRFVLAFLLKAWLV